MPQWSVDVIEVKKDNPDVDLFCLDEDFEEVENILQILCKENNWKKRKTFLNNRRPKIEILILRNKKDKKEWTERLSLVPAYIKNNQVELKFIEGSGEYPLRFLQQTERKLDDFVFYTISN